MADKKTWENVYVLRQEYNPHQRCWFPIIVYLNRSKMSKTLNRWWEEALCTETGDSFYHTEVKDYTSTTKKGTDKCDPKHVEFLVNQWKNENDHAVYEVKKLNVYRKEARHGR